MISYQGPGDRRPGRRSWVAVAVAALTAIGLVAVIVLNSAPGGQLLAVSTTLPSPTTQQSVDSTTTTVAPTSTTTILGAGTFPLSDLVPGAIGTLHAVVGDSGRAMISWATQPGNDPSAQSRQLSSHPGLALGYDLDAGGALIAYVVDASSKPDPGGLEVFGPGETLSVSEFGVNSAVWHETEPRRMAAVRVMPDSTADLITIGFRGSLANMAIDPITDLGVQHTVVAWGDYGFVIAHRDVLFNQRIVTLLDQTGDVVWQLEDSTVFASQGENLLLGPRRTSASTFEYEITPIADPSATERIELPDGAGAITGADWSSDGQRLALQVNNGSGSDWSLLLFDEEGRLNDRIGLDWRMWYLTWSQDDRFIVMPGTDDAGTHVIVFYDTLTGDLTPVEIGNWVHWIEIGP